MSHFTKVSSDINIKARSSEQSRKAFALMNHDDKNVRTLAKMYVYTKQALKIIAEALVDEKSDFFADIKNFTTILNLFKSLDIDMPKDFLSSEKFNTKPTEMWIDLIFLLFTVLVNMDDNGGVKVLSAREDYSSEINGMIMELPVSIYSDRKKNHLISVVVNKNNNTKYIAIDNTPMLVALSR